MLLSYSIVSLPLLVLGRELKQYSKSTFLVFLFKLSVRDQGCNIICNRKKICNIKIFVDFVYY